MKTNENKSNYDNYNDNYHIKNKEKTVTIGGHCDNRENKIIINIFKNNTIVFNFVMFISIK